MRIKFSQEIASNLTKSINNIDSNITKIGVKLVDNVLSPLGTTKIKRTFPYCGKFEKRTHTEGLDLWYDITFDKSTSLTKANSNLSSINGINIVEYLPKMSLPKYSSSIINSNVIKRR